MKRTTSAACLFLLMSTAFGAAAPAWGSPQGEPQNRLRLRRNISDLYLLRLTRALDLTEDQTAKIYPLLIRVEKEKAEVQQRMGQDLRDLRAELAGPRPGEARVLELARKVREARRAVRQKDAEVEEALESVLTPVQQGKYLLFTVDFLRGALENLGRAGGQRPPLKRTP